MANPPEPHASLGRKGVARDQAVRLEIARARRLHDLRWQRRRRRVAVPLPLLLQPRQVIAQWLLVEARLRASRLVAARRPQALRVGPEDLLFPYHAPHRHRTETQRGALHDDGAPGTPVPPR